MKELRDNHRCYVCGKDNPEGLRVRFVFDDAGRTISADFTPRREHEGWEGIVHGGVLTALMDEAMVKLAAHLGSPAVSAELTVRFRSPASAGEVLRVSACVAGEQKRLIEAEALIERGTVVIAEAKGKLLRTGPEG